MRCARLALVPLLILGCGDDASDEGDTGGVTETGTAGSAGEEAEGDAASADGGDGDGASVGDGDGDGDGTSAGDGDGTSAGDGDGTSAGDGDGTSGDGDGTSGDGDGTSGDGDGTSGDGDGTSGDGDGTSTSGDGDGTSTSGDGDGTCLQCTIDLFTNQSGSLEPIAPNTFLAEIYQTGQLVYALDEVGPGRVIYTGDSNILNEEMTDCPLYEWLGQTGASPPTIASIGSNSVCDGAGNSLPSYPTWTYLGQNVPAQYAGDPAALLADYDFIIYCPLRSMIDTVTMNPADATTLIDYVTVEGGGLYLVSEYFGGGLNQQAIDDVNSIANPLGANFLPTDLDWGTAGGSVQIGCFPEPQ